jgi:hypothetical protein
MPGPRKGEALIGAPVTGGQSGGGGEGEGGGGGGRKSGPAGVGLKLGGVLGRVVQVDSIQTRVESAYGFSA